MHLESGCGFDGSETTFVSNKRIIYAEGKNVAAREYPNL